MIFKLHRMYQIIEKKNFPNYSIKPVHDKDSRKTNNVNLQSWGENSITPNCQKRESQKSEIFRHNPRLTTTSGTPAPAVTV